MAAPFVKFFVFVGVSSHPKINKLGRLLGHHALGLWYAVRLWELATTAAPGTGVVESDVLERDDLEQLLGWTGKPGELIGHMLRAKLLDQGPPLKVHSWSERQPAIVECIELGEGSEGRAQRRAAQGELPIEVAGPPSELFMRWWQLVPKGMQQARAGSYKAWRSHGLDAPEEAEKAIGMFRKQLAHDGWRERFLRNGTALSYMRREGWLDWSNDREARTVDVPLVQLPQRPDEKDLSAMKAEWYQVPGNETREWPGADVAQAELVHALVRKTTKSLPEEKN